MVNGIIPNKAFTLTRLSVMLLTAGCLGVSPTLRAADPATGGDPMPNLVSNASYTNIVDTTMPAPSQSTTFYDFESPAISGSNVAFLGYYNNDYNQGIYTGVAGMTGVTRIADSSTLAPGQSTTFVDFSVPAISGNNVAFFASYNNSNGQGIYTGVAGTTGATRIADISMVAPNQNTTFSGFDNPALSGSNVAFLGYYNNNYNQGIYTGVAGTTGVTCIADHSTLAPGQSTIFSVFGNPAISGSNVAFFALYNSNYGCGIYTGVAGTTDVTRIADSSMIAPGQSTTFSGFGGSGFNSTYVPAISGSNVAFVGYYNNGNGQGVYTGMAGMTGAARIADLSTLAPGQSATFSGFVSPALSGSNVAFFATYNGGSGIYTGVAGTTGVTRIADSSMIAPGQSTTFYGFGSPAISGSNVTFLGYYNGGSGIFLYRGGSLLDVAESGESLFGSTISSLDFSASGLDGDSLAFYYTLANGVSGEAMFVVPEPTTWTGGALLLGGVALTLRHRLSRPIRATASNPGNS